MASENAKMAARKVAKVVSENIRKGKRVNLGKILRKTGYSKSVSLKPKLVTSTKSYKDEMDDVVKKMKEERDRALNLMRKKIGKAKYRDLTDGVDKMTKNVQLLEGKPTEINKLTTEDVEERIKQLRAIGGRSKSAGDK